MNARYFYILYFICWSFGVYCCEKKPTKTTAPDILIAWRRENTLSDFLLKALVFTQSQQFKPGTWPTQTKLRLEMTEENKMARHLLFKQTDSDGIGPSTTIYLSEVVFSNGRAEISQKISLPYDNSRFINTYYIVLPAFYGPDIISKPCGE